MRKLIVLLIFILSTSFAQANTQDPYFEISKVKVELLSSSENSVANENYVEQDVGTQIGEVIEISRQIIAFGKEIYKLVEAGKPVINTEYTPISVLPNETDLGKDIRATDLSHWKTPKYKKFKLTYTNGFGAEVVAFTYNVNMSPGGKYQGKGSYISHAQIVPEHVSVAWGYDFDAKMSLVGLTNLGSDEEPIAGATLQLSYTVSTIVKEERNNMTIFLSGDGTIHQM